MKSALDPKLTEPLVWPWWRHVLLHVVIWCSIGVAFAVQVRFYGVAEWDFAFRIAAIDWAPWIVLGPLTYWLGQKVQFSRRTWLAAAAVHLAACAGLAALVGTIGEKAMEHNWVRLPGRPAIGAVPAPMRVPPDMPPPDFAAPADRRPGGPPVGFRGDAPPGGRMGPERAFLFRVVRRPTIAIYWILVTVAHAMVFRRRALERERHALQAEASLVEARLTTLQAQLNPHFLFNTLNTIVHYVRADPDAAEEMLTTLSELLRSVLAHSDRREVPLEQELAFIDHYLAIQRVRFADRLFVRKEIAPATLAATVPTLILQPLVENAVIHGVAPERTPGTVFVRATIVEGRLRLEVADTGKGVPVAQPAGPALAFEEGVGLSNTRARLAALYGDDFHFTIAPAPEGGVCVRIDIPLRVPNSP